MNPCLKHAFTHILIYSFDVLVSIFNRSAVNKDEPAQRTGQVVKEFHVVGSGGVDMNESS